MTKKLRIQTSSVHFLSPNVFISLLRLLVNRNNMSMLRTWTNWTHVQTGHWLARAIPKTTAKALNNDTIRIYLLSIIHLPPLKAGVSPARASLLEAQKASPEATLPCCQLNHSYTNIDSHGA